MTEPRPSLLANDDPSSVSTGPQDAAQASAAGRPPRVVMERICKSYGTIESLKDASLRLEAGEVLGLVGDNGAGKSTLTKILAGAEIPDSGQILIDGEKVRFANPAEARARQIEMVYQDLALCNTIDVAGNLFLGREPTRRILGFDFLDKKRMHTAANDMLQDLGVRVPDTRLRVQNLSGGQRQSIAICRAVSFRPTLLIMDEPTAALAVAEVEAVLRLIREVSDTGVSVILITHRLQDLFVVCDRIMVLYEGRNVAERPVGETSLEEIVQLIVGERYARVGGRPQGGRR